MRHFYADDRYAPNGPHEDSSDEDPCGGAGDSSGSKFRYENDPEVWQDYYSEELVCLFHAALDSAVAQGLPILDKCTFNDFATFCFQKSSGVVPR
jgi:hypothetical protein